MLSRATQVINNMNFIREEFVRFRNHVTIVIMEKFPTVSPIFRTDGELYTKELTFDQISGMTRLVNSVSPVEHKLRYYMFDLMLESRCDL